MREPRRRAGFTLIELMAVVMIFALLAGFVAPNLGILSSRRLQQQAEQISAQLELGRQRAIVTGIPHRLAIDLEAGSYWLEWYVTEAEALGEPETPVVLNLRGTTPISLAPPRAGVREFRPLPGMFGRPNQIEDSLSFHGVDTLDGTIDRGEAFVEFDRDGSASPIEIVLGDDDGHALALEVLPLADVVRIHDVEL
jgi:prepilin-type N-terminal cleavage/methylation domain-containing protein